MLDPARPFLGALNHVLQSAPWARERLAPHAGRVAQLSADPVRFRFSITAQGTLEPSAGDAPPAVTLALPLGALPHFVAGAPEKAMSAVRIEGSADLADALGFVFRHLRWDVEEDLSRVLGDVVAHRVVAGARSLAVAQARGLRSLSENVAEYLGEEQRLVVTQLDVHAHERELLTLRDDIARLDKRLDRLARRR